MGRRQLGGFVGCTWDVQRFAVLLQLCSWQVSVQWRLQFLCSGGAALGTTPACNSCRGAYAAAPGCVQHLHLHTPLDTRLRLAGARCE